MNTSEPIQQAKNMFEPSSSIEIIAQSFILAIRQNNDQLGAVARMVESQNNKLDTITGRLSHIEGMDLGKKFEKLETDMESMRIQIDRLQADKDKRDGVHLFLEWCSKIGPWLIGMGAAFLAVANAWKGNK
jgi:hypothetical protein